MIRKTSKQDQSFIARLKLLPLLVLLSFLGACASSVKVTTDIPAPLVERVPLNVHLHYTEEFKTHVYEENEKRRALKSLDLAQAQTDMFNAIFGGMTNLVAADDPSRDITIEPEILDFQYTAPSETKLKQYEIWIKYRLKLIDKDDSKLADWTIKGYGKTPTALLTSASQAFNSAANIALRDVGAQLATRFAGQRRIKAIIDQKGGQSSTEPQVAQALETTDAEIASAENSASVDDAELVQGAEQVAESTVGDEQ